MEVYSLEDGDDGVKRIGTFPSRSPSCALQEQCIFTAVGDNVEKRNLSGGSVMTTLSFTEAEGRPMHLDANGKFLAVVTNKGIIKMFDVSRREPKQLFSAGKFSEADSPSVLVGIVKSIRCNADGTYRSSQNACAASICELPIHVYMFTIVRCNQYFIMISVIRGDIQWRTSGMMRNRGCLHVRLISCGAKAETADTMGWKKMRKSLPKRKKMMIRWKVCMSLTL